MKKREKNKGKIRKRLLTLILAVVMVCSSFSLPGTTEEAQAASTATMKLSEHFTYSCSLLGYKNHTMWNLMAGGKQTYCLTPGGSCCTGDVYTVSKYNAVTFGSSSKDGYSASSLKAIAKCLTYYCGKSNSKKNHAAQQAYIWACANGKSKSTMVYQVVHSIDSSFSKSDATKLCNAIADTDPEGTIYYYKINKCKNGYSKGKHQILIRITSTPYASPSYDSVTYKNSGSGSENIKLTINKKDSTTGNLIDVATFAIYRDNSYVTTVSTKNGVASYTYEDSYKTSAYSSTKKYVTNWDQLSVSQQTKATSSGYYSSKDKATAAAKAEVTEKINAALKKLKEATHTWKIVETGVPSGYYVSTTNPSKTITESGTTTSYSTTFTNTPQTGTISIAKTNKDTGDASVLGTEASMEGVQYTVYANADIYSADGKTLKYKKNATVGVISLSSTTWKGSLSGLPLGSYYVKETSASTGFALDTKTYYVTLTSTNSIASIITQTLNVTDDEYDGYFKITKYYGEGSDHSTYDPEYGATFDIINSKGEVVETLTTNRLGQATSGKLPYGTYTVRQTGGTEGYAYAADFFITIDATTSGTTIEQTVYNEKYPDNGMIEIIKTLTRNDEESGIYEKSPESDAVFEIIDSNNDVVETLTTDENGYAKSGELSDGTYTVHQVSGTAGYDLVADFEVVVDSTSTDTPIYTYNLENPYRGIKVKLYKTMTDGTVSTAEIGATFLIVDKGKAKDAGISLPDGTLSDSARETLVNKLEADTTGVVIGTMTTDESGYAEFTMNVAAVSDAGFVLVQTSGEDGYSMVDLQEMTDGKETSSEDGQYTIYTYTLKDEWEDWGQIAFTKYMTVTDNDKTTGDGAAKAEVGAVFTIEDAITGEVVETLTTDENGDAQSGKLPFGTYLITQTKSVKGHETVDTFTITLDESTRGKVYDYGDIIDQETDITVSVIKKDEESETLLEGAVFYVYNTNDRNTVVTTLVTDENGTASCTLPYGTYILVEVDAPENYVMDSEEKEFTLSYETVTYDEDGNPVYSMTIYNKQLYGHLTLNKTGQVLTGYSTDEGFLYSDGAIPGATYELYAREDITDASGNVVHKKDDLICKAITDDNGQIVFYRKLKDGTTTIDLYLGSYYVYETSVPDGFLLDTTVYDVDLTAEKPDNEDDYGEDYTVPDEEEETGFVVTEVIALSAEINAGYETVAPGTTLTANMFTVNATTNATDDDGDWVIDEDIDMYNVSDYDEENDAGNYYVIDISNAPNEEGDFDVTISLFGNSSISTTVTMTAENKTVAFAVYSEDDNSLTFYKRSESEVPSVGVEYNDKTVTAVYTGFEDADFATDTDVPWHGILDKVQTVDVVDVISPVSMAYWFYCAFNLEEINNASNLNTSNVTSLNSTFMLCQSLTKLDVSEWKTSQVTSLYCAFSDCISLETLDVSSWNISNVTSLGYTFNNCESLETLNVSGWNTSNVTTLDHTFYYCKKLSTLDVSGWNTTNVQSLSNTFYYCMKLTTLDVSNWTTSGVTSLNATFYYCIALTELDVSNWTTSNVTSMKQTFAGCRALTSLELDNWDTSKVTNTEQMFYECSKLTATLTLKNKVLNYTQMFTLTSTVSGTSFVLKYASSTYQATAEAMVATASTTSNVTCELLSASATAVSLEDVTYAASFGNLMTVSTITPLATAEGENTEAELDMDNETIAYDAENAVTEVNYTLNVTDQKQSYRILIYKKNKAGEPVSGCTFTVTANVDILDAAGNVIIPEGTVIATVTTDDNGYADFGSDYPISNLYSSDTSKDMYMVKETDVPLGYELSSVIIYASGEANKDTSTPGSGSGTENYTEGAVTEDDDAAAETIFEKEVINTYVDYVQIKKVWSDGNATLSRPQYVDVTVADSSGNTVGEYRLTADDDWTVTTKLPARDGNGNLISYSFSEVSVPTGYTSTVSYVNGVATFTNTKDNVTTKQISVKKEWDDNGNVDGIRPESVTVELYRYSYDGEAYAYDSDGNELPYTTVILNADNSWEQTVTDLPVADADGNEYTYQWKEVKTDVITGEWTNGYAISYAVGDDEETTITNTHIPQETSISVKKLWNDGDNRDKIRAESIYLQLYTVTGSGDTKTYTKVDSTSTLKTFVTLDENSGWSASITGLSRYDNGKAITYEFLEVDKDGNLITSAASSEKGYVVSYSYDENYTSATVATVTNTYTPKDEYLMIQKVSSDTALTTGNSLYSLEGAVYGVYETEDDAEDDTNRYATLITDASGMTATCTVPRPVSTDGKEASKTYYVKEITASQGYTLDTTIHPVTVSSEDDADSVKTITSEETPITGDLELELTKSGIDSSGTALNYGDSMKGAIFVLEYWSNDNGSISSAADRSWYFMTDEDGKIDFADKDYLLESYAFSADSDTGDYKGTTVYSDDVSTDDKEAIVYPLGTYRLREISAPAHYAVSGTITLGSAEANTADGVTFRMQSDTSGKLTYDVLADSAFTSVKADDLSKVAVTDTVKYGVIKVQKYAGDTEEPLAGVEFQIKGKTTNETYTAKTDENGLATFENLLPDTYELTEISSVEGYTLYNGTIEIELPMELTTVEVSEKNADLTNAVYDEAAGKYCFYSVSYEVTNGTIFKLPFTGYGQYVLYVVLAAALGAVLAGLLLARKKKSVQHVEK